MAGFLNCIALLIGWIADLFLGDPIRLPHPVVYMGKWIAAGEKILNKGPWRMLKGAIFAILSILLTFALFWLSLYGLRKLPHGEVYSTLVSAVCVFYCLAGKTLRDEVRMVFEAADRGEQEAQRQVARIVGRDTDQLSKQECRTAALETLAENLSDGIIAPLFWWLVLGVPGMMTYKMINTFDSMLGYHTARYKRFGCWAARIDDIANYLPARITAFLMLLASHLPHKGTPTQMGLAKQMGFVWHFGPLHASPNSGWPEAALASILNCRFGGPHNYFGEYFYKPFIGREERIFTTADMHCACNINLTSEILFVAAVLITKVAFC